MSASSNQCVSPLSPALPPQGWDNPGKQQGQVTPKMDLSGNGSPKGQLTLGAGHHGNE